MKPAIWLAAALRARLRLGAAGADHTEVVPRCRDERQEEQRRGRHARAMAPANFCTGSGAGRTGEDRLARAGGGRCPRRRSSGRFVAAGAVLLERLHHDPVEVAAHELRQRLPAPSPARRATRQTAPERAEPRARLRRLLLADDPHASPSKPASRSALAVERQRARSAARRAARPARRRRCACRCPGRSARPAPGVMYSGVPTIAAELGEQRAARSAAAPVALATPKSMTFGTGRPSCSGDQDVRRLEVAVDDPLLMRVLDRLADLDEQLQPLRASSAAAASQYSVIGTPLT